MVPLWESAQRLLPSNGMKRPARCDKWAIMSNVLYARAVYLLPVHSSAEKEHSSGSQAVLNFLVGMHASYIHLSFHYTAPQKS
jgi:hypothetical protein